VHSCYEAGAFGCVLHRKLVALGIKNGVVRPRDWDAYHKKVKTDRRDALALCGMPDRHLAGNTGALCVIRVPSEAGEQSRGQTRQRDSLVKDRGRTGNRGLSTARYYGFDLPAHWWRPRAFTRLAGGLPAHLYETLARWQAPLLEMDRQIFKNTITIFLSEIIHTNIVGSQGNGYIIFENTLVLPAECHRRSGMETSALFAPGFQPSLGAL
jgi:hypothetical protein